MSWGQAQCTDAIMSYTFAREECPQPWPFWPLSFASLMTPIQENQLGTHVLGFHLPHAQWPSGHCSGVMSKETHLHVAPTFLACSLFKCQDKEIMCRAGGEGDICSRIFHSVSRVTPQRQGKGVSAVTSLGKRTPQISHFFPHQHGSHHTGFV